MQGPKDEVLKIMLVNPASYGVPCVRIKSKPAACKAALCGPRFSLQPLMMHFSEFLPVFKQLSLIHANATVSTVKKTLKSSALASSLLQFGLTSVYLFLWVEHLGFVKCIILG